MTASELAERLHARRAGQGWKALCPAHDDRNASLSFRAGRDGGVVLHCHAGCGFDDIVRALGCEPKDLCRETYEEPKATKARIDCTYTYKNAKGEAVYQVVRLTPKGFRQRRWDGRWIWNLDGVRRVAYHLPEILANPEATVFVVEGEKDADLLEKLGLLATTNAGGAGKWGQEETSALETRRVVVIPDNDEPGRRHAMDVVAKLTGHAASVCVLTLPDLPPKGDVSDWLATHSVEALSDLATQALRSAATHTADVWFDRERIVAAIRAQAKEPWVALSIGTTEIISVRTGGLVTLSGPTGSGKTSLAAQLATAHAQSQGWAIIASRELPIEEFGARMIGSARNLSWKDALTCTGMTDEEMIAALPARLLVAGRRNATIEELAQRLGGIRAVDEHVPLLAIVDFGQLLAGRQPNADSLRLPVGAVWVALDEIARTHRAVILVLSQMSRASSREARAGGRLGAQAIDGGAEASEIERLSSVVLEIGAMSEQDEHGRARVQLSIAKGRMGGGDMVLPCEYDGRTGAWSVTGVAVSAHELRAQMTDGKTANDRERSRLAIHAAAMLATEPLSDDALLRAARVGRAGREIIDALLATGELVRVQRQRRGRWLIWTEGKAVAAGIPLRTAEEGDDDVDVEVPEGSSA